METFANQIDNKDQRYKVIRTLLRKWPSVIIKTCKNVR